MIFVSQKTKIKNPNFKNQKIKYQKFPPGPFKGPKTF